MLFLLSLGWEEEGKHKMATHNLVESGTRGEATMSGSPAVAAATTTPSGSAELHEGDHVFTPYGEGRVLELRRRDARGVAGEPPVTVTEVDAATTTTIQDVVVEMDWAVTGPDGRRALAYLRRGDVRLRKKLYEMTEDEKLERARMHRAQGNVLFKVEAYEEAARKYELARVYLRQVTTRALTAAETAEDLVPVLNNAALAMLRAKPDAFPTSTILEACDEAVVACNAGAPNQLPKSLYLRALVRRRRGGNLDLALEDLTLSLIHI